MRSTGSPASCIAHCTGFRAAIARSPVCMAFTMPTRRMSPDRTWRPNHEPPLDACACSWYRVAALASVSMWRANSPTMSSENPLTRVSRESPWNRPVSSATIEVSLARDGSWSVTSFAASSTVAGVPADASSRSSRPFSFMYFP